MDGVTDMECTVWEMAPCPVDARRATGHAPLREGGGAAVHDGRKVDACPAQGAATGGVLRVAVAASRAGCEPHGGQALPLPRKRPVRATATRSTPPGAEAPPPSRRGARPAAAAGRGKWLVADCRGGCGRGGHWSAGEPEEVEGLEDEVGGSGGDGAGGDFGGGGVFGFEGGDLVVVVGLDAVEFVLDGLEFVFGVLDVEGFFLGPGHGADGGFGAAGAGGDGAFPAKEADEAQEEGADGGQEVPALGLELGFFGLDAGLGGLLLGREAAEDDPPRGGSRRRGPCLGTCVWRWTSTR